MNSYFSRIASFCRNLLQKRRVERELSAELGAFVDLAADAKAQSGLAPSEARRQALRESGGIEQIKEEVREARAGYFVETFVRDLRFGFRSLRKTPAFSIVALLTIALGIGANTAIFSVVNAVLLRALPYHNSERLVDLFSTDPNGTRDSLSIPELTELQAKMDSLEDLAGFQSQSVNLTGGERPERVRGAFVSVDFFRVFNLTPVLGRTLASGEDDVGAEKLVVVNEKLWRERLNGDLDLSTKKLILNGEAYSVIGVISSNFKNPFDPDVEVWLSMTNFPGNTGRRDSRFMIPLGHLKPGVPVARAQMEASAITSQWAAAYPKENAGRGVKVDLYQDYMVGQVRPMLWLLFLAAGVILVIACANLANLLLARGVTRQREMAVRAALGASRRRMIFQLLTETSLLGVAGGVGGLLLAHWGLWGLIQLPQNFYTQPKLTIDGRVLLFAIGASLITGWLFGLVPALQLARTEVNGALKEGGRGSGDSARWNRIRGGFVVVQVAFSILLLIGAGLLVRSFDRLLHVDVGFNPANLLTLEYRLPRTKYVENDSQWNFHRQVIQEVQRLPGVQSAALIRSLPFSGNGGSAGIGLLDREEPPKGREPHVLYNIVTPNFFETVLTPLLQGRVFGDQDQTKTPLVLLINQTMAKKYWPGQDPIGKQIKLLEDGTVGSVVGVVGDTKQYWVHDEATPQLYASYSQQPTFFATLVVRTAVEPLSLSQSVRQAIWKVDPDQPMWKIRTVEFLIQRNIANRKFLLALMVIFAALAVVLTLIGLYGVISYLVNQRTQEIGVRMALGASVSDILKLILGQGLKLTLIGVMIGLVCAFAFTRLLSSLLFDTSATDPQTFLIITALLTGSALLACFIPARRATKISPTVALRYE